jgi:transcriptional repressor NrdR
MNCPSCGSSDNKVIDSRATRDGRAVRRRRACKACKRRFTTYEYVEDAQIVVVKKDGRREPFSRDKLFRGIQKACEKRPVPQDSIWAMVDRIETEFQKELQSEAASGKIGGMVMEELSKLDEVAYVRFASVYRHFKDINQFMAELRSILGEK